MVAVCAAEFGVGDDCPARVCAVPVLIDAVSATAIIAIVAAKASIRIASPKKPHRYIGVMIGAVNLAPLVLFLEPRMRPHLMPIEKGHARSVLVYIGRSVPGPVPL